MNFHSPLTPNFQKNWPLRDRQTLPWSFLTRPRHLSLRVAVVRVLTHKNVVAQRANSTHHFRQRTQKLLKCTVTPNYYLILTVSVGTTNLSVSVSECILAFRSHPVKTNPNRAEIDDESGGLFLLQTGRPYNYTLLLVSLLQVSNDDPKRGSRPRTTNTV